MWLTRLRLAWVLGVDYHSLVRGFPMAYTSKPILRSASWSMMLRPSKMKACARVW